jgi:putative transposase
MPTGLKRYYGRGHLHFITFSCYRRLPFLGAVRAKNLFVKELSRVRQEYKFGRVAKRFDEFLITEIEARE